MKKNSHYALILYKVDVLEVKKLNYLQFKSCIGIILYLVQTEKLHETVDRFFI